MRPAVGVEQRKLDGVIRVRGAALQEQLFDFEAAARLDHAPVTLVACCRQRRWKQIVVGPAGDGVAGQAEDAVEFAIRQRVAAGQILQGDCRAVIEDGLQPALGIGQGGHRAFQRLGPLDDALLELGVEAAYFIVGAPALRTLGGLGERPSYGRRQPRHSILQHVVGGALLHALDRELFPDAARQKNERQFGAEPGRDLLRRDAVERR